MFDSYIILYDKLGQTKYISAKELGHTDSTKSLSAIHSIGGRLLIVNSAKELFWQGTTPVKLQTSVDYSNDPFSDKKATLYYINNNVPKTIYSFHSDGTYQERLVDKKKNHYNYNTENGSVKVYTTDGVYELSGKSEQVTVIPLADQLMKSSYIRSLKVKKGNDSLDIILSKAGFNIKKGSSSVTYLFAGKTEIVKDSLDFQAYNIEANVNFQKDSTLVLSYTFNSDPAALPTHIYLFTYKNGGLMDICGAKNSITVW